MWLSNVGNGFKARRIGREHIRLTDPLMLNFLDQENELFHYPYFLYSPGHGNLDVDEMRDKESIIFDRHRDTFLMTDSGGFQIINGRMSGIWDDKGNLLDEKRLELLRWMENIADAMMTLDVPLFSLSDKAIKNYRENIKADPPYETPQDCLNYTNQNLVFFNENKTGAKPFINIVHGDNVKFARRWYNTVKWFDADGWAFAGTLGGNLHLTMNTLMYMKFDGALVDKRWFHFLGHGTSFAALVLSKLQEMLRERSPDIQVTFDAANPFLNAGRYNLINFGVERRARKNQFITPMKPFNACTVYDPEGQYPRSSGPIMEAIPWGDIVVDPTCRIGGSNMDGLGSAVIMSNNAYQYIDVANKSYIARDAGEMSRLVQKSLNAIEDIFEAKTLETARKRIGEHQDALHNLMISTDVGEI